MNNSIGALALVLLISTTVSVSALDRRVQISNASSFDIVRFYASNTGSKSWEEDILGDKILPSGQSAIINIDDGSGYCKYDFLAIFSNDQQITSANNNVCELSQFSFTD